MKKVLILTVTAGNGHNSNAKAVYEKIKEMEGENVDIKIVDVLKSFSNKLNVWIADKGYALAMQLLPSVYDKFYNLYKKKPFYKRYACAAQGVALSIVSGLFKEINEFKPDVIYCTHFYPAIAISDLRLVYEIPCKVVVANLDYVNSPFWEACIGVDFFEIPNDDFVEECGEEGFKASQLCPWGIPVKDKFLLEIDKSEARKQLGMKQDVFTIMIIFGGGHWGGGYKIFKKIAKLYQDQNVQVVVINGKNKSSFDKIEKMQFKPNFRVVNVGFTDKVDMYMSASDVIVTKLGGMGATEAINKKRPMVVTKKVYGQERHNLKYLGDKGIVLSFNNSATLKNCIDRFKDDKDFYEKIVEKESLIRFDGLSSLVNLILSQPKARYDEDYIKNIDYAKIKCQIKKELKIKNKETIKSYKGKN